MTLLCHNDKRGDRKFTFKQQGGIGIMFAHAQGIVVEGVVKGSPAHYEEIHNHLEKGMKLKAVTGADGVLKPIAKDTFEDDCLKILKNSSRPVTLRFHAPDGESRF